MSRDILVTGARSGLGRFLAGNLPGLSLTRDRGIDAVMSARASSFPFAAIVHCAFDMRRDISVADFAGYISDTILLTDRLTRLPHSLFIFISSINVYPPDDGAHDEDEVLSLQRLFGLYSTVKLACEALVRQNCQRVLILRAGLLLGPFMRENNLTRLVRGQSGPFTLTADSGFSCVHYQDILAVIRLALNGDLTGVYNAVRDDVTTMAEVAQEFKRTVEFGSYYYPPRIIRNDRIRSLCPEFAASSMDAVRRLATELQVVR